MPVVTAAELERFMAREFRQMDHLKLRVEDPVAHVTVTYSSPRRGTST